MWTERRLLAAHSQLRKLNLLVPLEGLPQRWSKELPELRVGHRVHSLLEVRVLEVGLKVLIYPDWPPESVDGNDVLLLGCLVLLSPQELLAVEVVVSHVEIVRHQLTERQKELRLLGRDLISLFL